MSPTLLPHHHAPRKQACHSPRIPDWCHGIMWISYQENWVTGILPLLVREGEIGMVLVGVGCRVIEAQDNLLRNQEGEVQWLWL